MLNETKELRIGNKLRIDLDEIVYAINSSTIELRLKLCIWATIHHAKSTFKINTLIDLRSSIPIFIRLTDDQVHDSKDIDKITDEFNVYF